MQTKNINSDVLVPTEQTTAVSNIYDMGGNLLEYTTESYSDGGNPYVLRRGFYYYPNGSIYSAGYEGTTMAIFMRLMAFELLCIAVLKTKAAK